MVAEMVTHDLDLAKQHALLKANGYSVDVSKEYSSLLGSSSAFRIKSASKSLLRGISHMPLTIPGTPSSSSAEKEKNVR